MKPGQRPDPEEPSVNLLDAVERMHHVKRDLEIIGKLGRGPIPLVTAPWVAGVRQHGFFFFIEQPPTVHLWSHFETFPSHERMLQMWVVDEAVLYGEEEDDGL